MGHPLIGKGIEQGSATSAGVVEWDAEDGLVVRAALGKDQGGGSQTDFVLILYDRFVDAMVVDKCTVGALEIDQPKNAILVVQSCMLGADRWVGQQHISQCWMPSDQDIFATNFVYFSRFRALRCDQTGDG